MSGTVVNFGETYRLSTTPLIAAHNCRKSDLVIVMGTSMAVQPAVSYPLKAKRVVLVNMQTTPADAMAAVRCFSKCDHFTAELMAQLGISAFDMSY